MNGDELRSRSMAFAKRIVGSYQYLCESKREFILSKQLLRCGTSIGANISEAQYGSSRRDFLNKLYIALKEAAETMYWLRLLYECGYFSEQEYTSLNSECDELRRILSAHCKMNLQ